MTKQEEIREQMVEFANENYVLRPRGVSYQECMVDDMLRYLHSQGVVIKVDRKLPSGGEARLTLPSSKHLSYWRGWKQAQIDMTRAGYVAVEPLIKESMKYTTARIYDIDKSGKEVSNG